MDVCRSLIALVTVICLCYIGTLLFSELGLSVYQREGELERRRQDCDPEVCGQQCFSNNYMNAWCENFTCYCDNDCLRHRVLYPWDDETRTCAHLCNHKHGPCTGSGCANDTYWANSTWTDYGLHVNTSSWIPVPVDTKWRPQYYFFSSSVCFCYDNQTGVQDTMTTASPTTDDLASEEYNSSSEWKFWLNFNPLKLSKERSSEEVYGLTEQNEEPKQHSTNSESDYVETNHDTEEPDQSKSKESYFHSSRAESTQSSSVGDKSLELDTLSRHSSESVSPDCIQRYLKGIFRKQRKLQKKRTGKGVSRRNRYQLPSRKRVDFGRKQRRLFDKLRKRKKQNRKYTKNKRKHRRKIKKKKKAFNRLLK